MNERFISKKRLSAGNKYNYCPYCVKELEEAGKPYTDVLLPLWKLVTARPVERQDGTTKDCFYSSYICERCKRKNLDTKDFMIVYCRKADHSLYTEKDF
ncbi:MAG: hypothetical protein MJ174_07535 [Treponema sp.]|nr:hypothetical protein [Treponema sp.]